MNRYKLKSKNIVIPFLFIILILLSSSCADNSQVAAPYDLRCEYRVNPLGIDSRKPRLSWKLTGTQRGAAQTAYQIKVAPDSLLLENDNADIWDSGKIKSQQSAMAVYNGPAVKSAKRYYWKVRIWDEQGRCSSFSRINRWETALLEKSDWQAHWIAAPQEKKEIFEIPFGDWIWHPQISGQNKSVYFIKKIALNSRKKIEQAKIKITADDGFTLYVNGIKIGVGSQWRDIFIYDVAQHLKDGNNIIAAAAYNNGGSYGLTFGMKIKYNNGDTLFFYSDKSWLCSKNKSAGWYRGQADLKNWSTAAVVKKYGEPDWGWLEYRRPAKSYLFRKVFSLNGDLRKARIYVTGLGLYELYINGAPVGRDKLRPGWTRFPNRVQYQVYDVTTLLHKGQNTVGLMTGNGWWSSVMGGNWRNGQPRLICRLQTEQQNGGLKSIVSDTSWRVHSSPVIENSLWHGETYDARLEIAGWNSPLFDDSGWQKAVIADDKTEADLVAQQAPPMRVTQQLHPVSVKEPLAGHYVYDFGQNHAGRLRIKVRGKAGTCVQIRHAEILNADGTLNTDNYRMAKATDVYYLKGGEEEIYEPHFTYRGYRYAEISGLPQKLPLDKVVSQVIHNDLTRSGFFKCSNELINKIYRNIFWGQHSNLYSVPTDCPQRNERLGWTGDAQVFSLTACWNMDMQLFFEKWMRDIMDSQTDEGIIQNIDPTLESKPSSPGWGDAAVIIPWNVYLMYGDKKIIEENYAGMKKWIDYMRGRAENGVLYAVGGYGDWLSVMPSPAKPIGAAYYYYSTKLFSKMAAIIGNKEDEKTYSTLSQKIRNAFNNAYLDKNGYYPGKTQTSYVLPITFGLVPESFKNMMVKHLVENIAAQDTHLTTGFMGTAYMFKVLSENGFHETAYKMAAQRTYPSWGYEIENGATTVWEHWNSNRLDEVDASMNSFNHFALGSVGSWFFEELTGIEPDEGQPGFKRIIFHPRPVGDINWAEASYLSRYGKVFLRWEKQKNSFICKIIIPPNTTGLIYLPLADKNTIIRESGNICFKEGKVSGKIEGLSFLKYLQNKAVFEAAAGEYHFEIDEL